MRVLALRVSYVGELGYELHHPLELQRALYDRLWEAGADLGLVDFGYRALESLRLEKAYRLWGADMSADYTPLEAGWSGSSPSTRATSSAARRYCAARAADPALDAWSSTPTAPTPTATSRSTSAASSRRT